MAYDIHKDPAPEGYSKGHLDGDQVNGLMRHLAETCSGPAEAFGVLVTGLVMLLTKHTQPGTDGATTEDLIEQISTAIRSMKLYRVEDDGTEIEVPLPHPQQQ